MPPIVFSLPMAKAMQSSQRQKGVGPSLYGFIPLPTFQALVIYGVTKTGVGAALGDCTVDLFRTRGDVFVETTISDGAGNYSFTVVNPNDAYYIVAYKSGSPDLAGTTLQTLGGTLPDGTSVSVYLRDPTAVDSGGGGSGGGSIFSSRGGVIQ